MSHPELLVDQRSKAGSNTPTEEKMYFRRSSLVFKQRVDIAFAHFGRLLLTPWRLNRQDTYIETFSWVLSTSSVNKMQFTHTVLALSFTVATFATASTTLDVTKVRAPVPNFKVGWGQELQNHDQTNHWVVWVEGESACPAAIELAALTSSPCGSSFNLKGQQLSLADCSGNEPRSVHGSDGSKVLSCGSNGKNDNKITCQYVIHSWPSYFRNYINSFFTSNDRFELYHIPANLWKIR